MYEMLVCHRRDDGVGRTEFHRHWRNERRRLVSDLKGALGYSTYTQLHRASRLNVFYLGIRISRSWPLAALFSVVQGMAVPPLSSGRRGAQDERWDVVERFRYPSRDALLRASAPGPGSEAIARLTADGADRVCRRAVIVAEIVPIVDDASLAYPRTVALFCLRSRPPLGRSAMLDRWRTAHSALVTSLHDALGYRKYDQLHVRDIDAAANDNHGEPFDGVAMLAYGSQWELAKRLLDPRTQIANLRLAKDEVNFIDGGRSALVFGTEEAIES